MTGQREPVDLAVLLAGADQNDLHRLAWAVAAMHEPDHRGRCRYCRSDRPAWRLRWWRMPATGPCQTRRVIVAQLRTANTGPKWTPA